MSSSVEIAAVMKALLGKELTAPVQVYFFSGDTGTKVEYVNRNPYTGSSS